MAVTLQAGAGSLLSLGVSLADLAIFIEAGRRIGNWLRVRSNDEDLLASIQEVTESIVKRRGIIDPIKMKSRWSQLKFLYKGERSGTDPERLPSDEQDVSGFSWLMACVVANLTPCVTKLAMRNLLIDFMAEVLHGDDVSEPQDSQESLKKSLRVQLSVNINSWLSLASARGLDEFVTQSFTSRRRTMFSDMGAQPIEAIPQLNAVEMKEIKRLLKWLFAEPTNFTFRTLVPYCFLFAHCLQALGVHVNTGKKRQYEREPLVIYTASSSDKIEDSTWFRSNSDPFGTQRTVVPQVAQVAYPPGKPETMIETISVQRSVRNDMLAWWHMGSKAAEGVKLLASAGLPFSSESDINYSVEEFDPPTSRFDAQLTLLANHGFPVISESIMLAVESLATKLSPHRLEWLVMHTELGYLQKQTTHVSQRIENIEAFQQYSALVFGFYYRLFQPWVTFDYIRANAYLRGIWCDDSHLFLTMCTQFSSEMRREGFVTRSHILHLLATMYNGRLKMYSKSARSLLGVLGPASVLSRSLVHTSDTPQMIATFVVANLPIIDLVPERSGELYPGSNGAGIDFYTGFEASPEATIPSGPRHTWRVDAAMAVLFGEGDCGVLMAAQCGSRLVGWFNPLAADVAFLSSTYQGPRITPTDQPAGRKVKAHRVTDEHWQQCKIRRPCRVDRLGEDQVILVESTACPALRYAAAGFYTAAGEEVAIATNDIAAAVERLQGPGVVVP